MKKLLFLFGLMMCLLCVPITSMAAPTEEEKAKYQEAIQDKWVEMLKGSIALDTSTAANKTSLMNWLLAEKQPKEAKKIVAKIEKLEAEQAKDLESMDPYQQAKKTCDDTCNADGAKAALDNIIRIQKDRLKDQEELAKLWAKVAELIK